MTTTSVAINGRFLDAPPTGVQRYAREILARLPERLGDRSLLVRPRAPITPADEANVHAALAAAPSGWAQGPRGHLWEQARLPALLRSHRPDVLWSPANFGPVAVRNQLVVLHDIGPFVDPGGFDRTYRVAARAITRGLFARGVRIATPSQRVAGEVRSVLGRTEPIAVVPPGVGAPFTSQPLDDLDERASTYCLAVGLHDLRKRIDFLVALWPEVHRRTGLQLRITTRSSATTTVGSALHAGEGIVVHRDPDDDELAQLYSGALCLLWPSSYEGYGFPLLEAMATGTPFLATDVGAARELAVDPAQQILEPVEAQWVARIVDWHERGVLDLRRACAERARERSWEATADLTAELLVSPPRGSGS